MPAKKVKKSEGLRRTHAEDRPAIKPNKKASTKKRSVSVKNNSTVIAKGSQTAFEGSGSQTYAEYGKPTCLADII